MTRYAFVEERKNGDLFIYLYLNKKSQLKSCVVILKVKDKKHSVLSRYFWTVKSLSSHIFIFKIIYIYIYLLLPFIRKTLSFLLLCCTFKPAPELGKQLILFIT